jgi:hypothetical protein
MHEKLSAKNLAAVSARSAVTIRQLVDQNTNLMEKNASLETELATLRRENRIRDLAAEMDDKGLNAQLSFDEKLAHLRQIDDLDPVEEAVKMASGGIPIADLSDHPGRGSTAADQFVAFCLGY